MKMLGTVLGSSLWVTSEQAVCFSLLKRMLILTTLRICSLSEAGPALRLSLGGGYWTSQSLKRRLVVRAPAVLLSSAGQVGHTGLRMPGKAGAVHVLRLSCRVKA